MELCLQHHLNSSAQILGHPQCLLVTSQHAMCPSFQQQNLRAISHRKELNLYLNALGVEEMYKVELDGVTKKSVSSMLDMDCED